MSAGRIVARTAAEIADALGSLRRAVPQAQLPTPGLQFTMTPPPRGPLQRRATPFPDPDAGPPRRPERATLEPREIMFPRAQQELLPDGAPVVRYEPEIVVPLSPSTLNYFDQLVDKDRFYWVTELDNMFEEVQSVNELYQNILLFKRVRPRLTSKEAKALQQSMERAAVKMGVPADITYSNSRLFDYASTKRFDVELNPKRNFESYGELRAEITMAATGKKQGSRADAKRLGIKALAALDDYDTGPYGGRIGIARSNGVINELEEARLREALEYWRGQVYEGSSLDYVSTRGAKGLRVEEGMNAQEIYERVVHAVRTADDREEVLSILTIPESLGLSATYMDSIFDIADLRISTLEGVLTSMDDIATRAKMAAVGSRMSQPSSGLGVSPARRALTPEEEAIEAAWMFRNPEVPGWPRPAPLDEPALILSRVNQRLARLREQGIGSGALARPRTEWPEGSLSVARDPEEVTGGAFVPFEIEPRFKTLKVDGKRKMFSTVPRLPENLEGRAILSRGDVAVRDMMREPTSALDRIGTGDWVLSAPPGGLVPEEPMDLLIASLPGPNDFFMVSQNALKAGTEAQQQFAQRSGEILARVLRYGNGEERKRAIAQINLAKQDETISDRLLKELRQISVEGRTSPRVRPVGPLERVDVRTGRVLGEGESVPFAYSRARAARGGQAAPAETPVVSASRSPVMTMPMNFADGDQGLRMRPEFAGKSTMDLIIDGKRTGTTRNSIDQFRKPDGNLLEVGDVIEVTDRQGRKVKVEVTKAPYQLPVPGSPEQAARYGERWSQYEGWAPENYANYIGKWQIQYKLIT